MILPSIQSLKYAHWAKVYPVDLVGHHCYHLFGQLNFFVE